MRPPEFTGGNLTGTFGSDEIQQGFNEAAGIHRRKRAAGGELTELVQASMRPPEFTGGNTHPG